MNKKMGVTICILFAVPLALAQMRGGGGMGQGSGMGSGQMGSAGMGGRQTDLSDMSSSQMQQRRRQMHTTDLQEHKYRACSQSMNRVRNRLHQMSKHSGTQSLDLAQLEQLQDQLSNDIQDVEQQLDDLITSLNDDQKSADHNQIQDLMRSTKNLQAISDQLGYELDRENADSQKVREQIRKTDGAAKQVQKQERELAESIGIEP